jgi:hypothetical protein
LVFSVNEVEIQSQVNSLNRNLFSYYCTSPNLSSFYTRIDTCKQYSRSAHLSPHVSFFFVVFLFSCPENQQTVIGLNLHVVYTWYLIYYGEEYTVRKLDLHNLFFISCTFENRRRRRFEVRFRIAPYFFFCLLRISFSVWVRISFPTCFHPFGLKKITPVATHKHIC